MEFFFLPKCFFSCRAEEHLYQKAMQVILSKVVTPALFSISVKEAGRDFTYFIVVIVGIGVTGYF